MEYQCGVGRYAEYVIMNKNMQNMSDNMSYKMQTNIHDMHNMHGMHDMDNMQCNMQNYMQYNMQYDIQYNMQNISWYAK